MTKGGGLLLSYMFLGILSNIRSNIKIMDNRRSQMGRGGGGRRAWDLHQYGGRTTPQTNNIDLLRLMSNRVRSLSTT